MKQSIFKNITAQSLADTYNSIGNREGFFLVRYDDNSPESVEANFNSMWTTIIYSGNNIPEELRRLFDSNTSGDMISESTFLKAIAVISKGDSLDIESIKI